ncbi:MAG: hypothetical protein CUN55_12200 [Phototrophicales bacterium]|nr:MAG: hypothetical protein CUN55_12200 [Phototrophicales bacterium]
MSRARLLLSVTSLFLLTTLTGCFDLFGFPNVRVSHNDTWVAYLATDLDADQDLYQLSAVNLVDGTVIRFSEGDEQGAFAWHPTEDKIAYYNVATDGTTSIRVSTVDNPSTGEDVIGSFAFPSNWFVTQMEYSPDGTQLVMSVILSQGELFNEESSSSTEELNTAIYVANLDDGSVTPITTPGEYFPSIVTWNPSGTHVAFVAWADANNDGYIDVSGEIAEETFDITQVGIYNVATNEIEIISESGVVALSPTWIDDSTLGYIALNPLSLSPESALVIRGYDISSATTSNLFSAGDLGIGLLGMSASPDGSRLAFVGLSLDDSGGETDEDAPAVPAPIYVLEIASGELKLVYEYSLDSEGSSGDTSILIDVPVWTQDSSSLIITSANPLAAIAAGFATAFSDEVENPVILPTIIVDIESGEAQTITTELIGSSGIVQSLLSLAPFVDGMDQ